MKPTFSLISKTNRINYFQYKEKPLRLNLFNPYSVEEVIVGINGSKENVNKVITFRDSRGHIIERIFDFYNKPLRNRLYTYNEYEINSKEFVLSTTKKDYIINRNVIDLYKRVINATKNRFLFWSNNHTITNHIAYNIEKEDEIIFSQVKVSNIFHLGKELHKFIEFPRIKNGKKVPSKQRMLSFEVNKSDNRVNMKTITASGNITVPKDDDYLAFRALTTDDAKVPLTQRFLKECEMDNKDVTINPHYNPIHEDSRFCAIFDAEDGTIKFNTDHKFTSKSDLVNTARHETEHVIHYFLKGLLNKQDNTPWQNRMFQQFGPIKDKKTLKEAQAYSQSIENYVPYYINPERYRKNYIEIKANEKGKIEQTKYDSNAKTIRQNFKHIPKECL